MQLIFEIRRPPIFVGPIDQYRDADAFLLVYSTTSRETFTRIEHHYNRIISVKRCTCCGVPLAHRRSAFSIPIMLAGDNFDKVDKREVSREEGVRLAERLGCGFLETSTKTTLNVEICFYTLVRMIRENRERGKMIEADRSESERPRGEDKELKKKGKTLRNVICCGD
ncbi:5040_t:CDS:2 [Acaulospora colombiana]|uniref:5040_t:CDS:1 n=1 Tax=Acaulospora colombiana TaxID=27376 RepID=A0ACA9K668_9GLOM|nr:5040_t:CDS:2 [Acaulospora colombiana]